MADEPNKLIRREAAQSLVPHGEEWAAMKEQAAVLLMGGFAPAGFKTPEQILAVLLTAREIGIGYREALDNLSPGNGKLTPSADLQLAQCYRNLPSFGWELIESTEAIARGRMRRSPNLPWVESSWTAKEALNADLTSKDNWKKYQKDMLVARLKTRLIGIVAPDAVLACGRHSQEVVQDFEPEPAKQIKRVDYVDGHEVVNGEIIGEHTLKQEIEEESERQLIGSQTTEKEVAQ